MTDRPLEVTEMAIRVALRIVWFSALAALCLWWSWPIIAWGLNGFPEGQHPQDWRLFAYGFVAFAGACSALKAGGLFVFQLLPFLLARALQPGSPKVKRR